MPILRIIFDAFVLHLIKKNNYDIIQLISTFIFFPEFSFAPFQNIRVARKQ